MRLSINNSMIAQENKATSMKTLIIKTTPQIQTWVRVSSILQELKSYKDIQ